MTNQRVFPVEQTGGRLDRFLADRITDLSRAQIQHLIADGLVLVNGRPAKAATRLNPDDVVLVEIPEPQPVAATPEEMALNVVYEDEDLLVIDKPAGLVVHPAPGHAGGTLVNAILARNPALAALPDTLRPGIVHRLDKDTSGLMVVAKNEASQVYLMREMQSREVLKQYTALVEGHLSPEEGIIEAPIGRDPAQRQRMAVTADGREARTGYRVLEYVDNYSLLTVTLWTGRTHQIRVHLAAIGHPVVGDRVYGKGSALVPRQFLHASRLAFRLPSSGEVREFQSALPADLQEGLENLRRAKGNS